MSYTENISVHLALIKHVRLSMPVGSLKRMILIHRSIQGIIRAKADKANGTYA